MEKQYPVYTLKNECNELNFIFLLLGKLDFFNTFSPFLSFQER